VEDLRYCGALPDLWYYCIAHNKEFSLFALSLAIVNDL
jgi:hypothetical protein